MAVFTEFFTKLREDIDQSHQDRKQLYMDTRDRVNEIANEVREQLAGFDADLRETRVQIDEKAKQVRSQLAEFSSDLQAGGQAFRGGQAHAGRAHAGKAHAGKGHAGQDHAGH